ncbi:hypothetical protein DERP_004036 [Dermatophagoides pteronyssinus]|uniref:Uncharacterized protein n=1 Tax=Dermatophagoides pteronyssinus TaxID=6956 RepID=A0ABQ8J8G2_DERPT|nr:hypothetical protein DERP_004036 [Dermatophagoides pteronyssinus]
MNELEIKSYHISEENLQYDIVHFKCCPFVSTPQLPHSDALEFSPHNIEHCRFNIGHSPL